MVGGGPTAHAAYCELLSDAGFRPISTSTLGLARELACASAGRVDSMVIDLEERDAADVVVALVELKQLLPDLPLVILFGGASHESLGPVVELPLVEVLSKPVSFEAMRACLMHLLRRATAAARA